MLQNMTCLSLGNKMSINLSPLKENVWSSLTVRDVQLLKRLHYNVQHVLTTNHFQLWPDSLGFVHTHALQLSSPAGYEALTCNIITAWNILLTFGPVANRSWEKMSLITGFTNGRGCPTVSMQLFQDWFNFWGSGFTVTLICGGLSVCSVCLYDPFKASPVVLPKREPW